MSLGESDDCSGASENAAEIEGSYCHCETPKSSERDGAADVVSGSREPAVGADAKLVDGFAGAGDGCAGVGEAGSDVVEGAVSRVEVT